MAEELNVSFDFEAIHPNCRNILGEFIHRERDGHAFCITANVKEFHNNLNLPEIALEDATLIQHALYIDRYALEEFLGNADHSQCGLTVVEPFIYRNKNYYIGDSQSLFHIGRIYKTQTLAFVGNLENGIIAFHPICD